MRICNFLFALVASAFLMTSCQKENRDNLTNTETSNFRTELEEDYAKYIEEHGQLKVEYATLEELNKVFVENGMKPVTLEGIGMTEEEYRIGQERINNPEIAKERCSGYLAVYYGDMNNSGTLSSFDVFKASPWTSIYGDDNTVTTPAGSGYRRFGLFSSEVGVWMNTDNMGNLFLEKQDKDIAINIILGSTGYPCL